MTDNAERGAARSAVRLDDDRESASILVVDDSPISAAKLAMAMRTFGHRTETAANGADALRCLRERSFDLVLLDIVMP